MKRLTLSLALALSTAGLSRAADPPTPFGPVPTPPQLAWQQDELTLFVHFGINTFTGRSTGLGNEDPKLFNPTELDCRQWAQVAKETGFKGIILTAKHHDGFCLWPTQTTKFGVVSSDWKDGKGDVVRECADACRAEGVKFGLYCSPWDRSQSIFETDKPAYSTFYRQQLTELLSNYGPVYEMWFDGNKAKMADWGDVIAVVRKLQPDAVIKQGPRLDPIREDVRWVGNEKAIAPLTNWSVYPPPDEQADEPRIWFPVECDIPMIGAWFWNDKPPKTLPELLDIYYKSVGRNSILLLNVAPDKRGKFSDESVTRLREFHDAIRKTFSTDLAKGKPAVASSVRGIDPSFGADKTVDGDAGTYWTLDDTKTTGSVEIDLGAETEFNVLRAEEMISLGQRVAAYKWEAFSGDAWKTVADGTTIGYRKLDRFPKIHASKVRFTVDRAIACPTIRSLGVHLDTVTPPEQFEPANARAEVPPKTRKPS